MYLCRTHLIEGCWGAEQLIITSLSNRVQTEFSGRDHGLGFLFAVKVTESGLDHSLPPRHVEVLRRPSHLESNQESPHLAENSGFPWVSMLSDIESLLKLLGAHLLKSGSEDAHRHTVHAVFPQNQRAVPFYS